MSNLIQQAATLLRKADLYDDRKRVIEEVIGVKADGLRDLKDSELRELSRHLRILTGTSHLKKNAPLRDSADKMRKAVISQAYNMQWAKAGDWQTAIQSIDAFCMGPHGIYKKRLNEHTEQELNKVVTQFKSMYVAFIKQMAKK